MSVWVPCVAVAVRIAGKVAEYEYCPISDKRAPRINPLQIVSMEQDRRPARLQIAERNSLKNEFMIVFDGLPVDRTIVL